MNFREKLFSSKSFLYAVVVSRIALPIWIFFDPLFAILMVQFFDGIDGQIFFENNIKWQTYNFVDKVIDYWWYIFMFLFMVKTSNPALPIAMLLLLIRTIGQYIGVTKHNENIYILFPNIFEWFSILAILTQLSIQQMLLISVPFAIFVEWSVHHSQLRLTSKYILKKEIIWKK